MVDGLCDDPTRTQEATTPSTPKRAVQDETRSERRGHVVDHDAPPARQILKFPDAERLRDIKEAEKQKNRR